MCFFYLLWDCRRKYHISTPIVVKLHSIFPWITFRKQLQPDRHIELFNFIKICKLNGHVMVLCNEAPLQRKLKYHWWDNYKKYCFTIKKKITCGFAMSLFKVEERFIKQESAIFSSFETKQHTTPSQSSYLAAWPDSR